MKKVSWKLPDGRNACLAAFDMVFCFRDAGCIGILGNLEYLKKDEVFLKYYLEFAYAQCYNINDICQRAQFV